MNTLEGNRLNNALDLRLFRLDDIYILRSYYDLNIFIILESLINAHKVLSVKGYKKVFFHNRFYDIGFTDEVCNKSVLRFVIYILGSSDLLDHTFVHNNNGIRHRKRFFLIMCNEDKCDSDLFLYLLKLSLHAFTKLCIQGTKRLIQKKNLWFIYKSSGYCHSLLLTAGQTGYISLCIFSKSYKLEH